MILRDAWHPWAYEAQPDEAAAVSEASSRNEIEVAACAAREAEAARIEAEAEAAE